MAEEVDPITDDEIVYRRIPAIWYDPITKVLSPEAFAPNKERDTTGLSVFRAKYKSVDSVAVTRPGKSSFVAKLRVVDIRNAGIEIEPRPNTPNGFDKAHAELPALNSGTRKDAITKERERILVQLCENSIEGPFVTPIDPH